VLYTSKTIKTSMRQIFLKIIVVVMFLATILTNYLANALPINNITTGGVSNAYLNLFAPASITFSIWGLIYILLFIYIIYQLGLFEKLQNEELIQKVRIYFIISCLANILWIFSWHYDYIGLSTILIIALLLSLIKINYLLKEKKLTTKEYYFMKLPFIIYFGWITIAVIANITTFLVSINWQGFGISEQIWTMIILVVGAVIGVIVTLKHKDAPYTLVLIWAYFGILIKHVSETGFNQEYTEIITIIIFCIMLLILVLGFTLKKHFTIAKSRTSTF
jgi:hypothetical protein